VNPIDDIVQLRNAVAAAAPSGVAAPADTRCLRCGGTGVERTDHASHCWDCAGTGTDTSAADDIYRGEP